MPMVNFTQEELEAYLSLSYGAAPWDDESHPMHDVAISGREKLEQAKRRSK